MSVHKRGRVYWMRFQFEKRQVWKSCRTSSKALAQEIETAERQKLTRAVHGIAKKRKRVAPPSFTVAASAWLESKDELTPLGRAFYKQYIGKLCRHLGSRLVCDITADDIKKLQKLRQDEGLSGRQINCEINTLRIVLKHSQVWSALQDDAKDGKVIKMLAERTDVGRALELEEESRLLAAIAESPSPGLYPMFLLALDAGLRPSEIRALRRENLKLTWSGGTIVSGTVVVGQSKTEASSGRSIPLTRRVCGALTLWLSRFPQAQPKSFVFPFHRVGFAGNGRKPHIWAVDIDRPASRSNYKRSFETACSKAQVKCRFYDARHSFITKLAENATISEETIRQLAGHVSKEMLKRYAHIRDKARREAINALDEATVAAQVESDSENLMQKLLQSDKSENSLIN